MKILIEPDDSNELIIEAVRFGRGRGFVISAVAGAHDYIEITRLAREKYRRPDTPEAPRTPD